MNKARTQGQSESDGDGAIGANRDLPGADENTAEQVWPDGGWRSAVRGGPACWQMSKAADPRAGEALSRWKRSQLVKPFELATQLAPSMG